MNYRVVTSGTGCIRAILTIIILGLRLLGRLVQVIVVTVQLAAPLDVEIGLPVVAVLLGGVTIGCRGRAKIGCDMPKIGWRGGGSRSTSQRYPEIVAIHTR